MIEYNNIGKKYMNIENNILRQYMVIPTALHLLKNIKNKSVLDVGCGYGYFSRVMKKKGASNIVGVDISEKMIDLAKYEEKVNSIGLKYGVQNVLYLPRLGEFDIALAVYLFHYSKTKQELLTMFKNTYLNLKVGGKLIILNNNPSYPTRLDKKYDVMVTSKKQLKESGPLTVTLFSNGEKVCHFKNYFYRKETYEKILREVGFKYIKWHKPIISDQGLKKFGNFFWKDYLEKPHTVGITCVK